MKMYEKLGIDLTTKEGIEQVMDFCPNLNYSGDNYCRWKSAEHCKECKVTFFFSDVPISTMKRWEIYDGDFKKALYDFSEYLRLRNEVKDRYTLYEFTKWLEEEIEIEEEE